MATSVDFATPYAAVKSRRVVLTDRVAPATLVIRDGRIAALLEYEASRDRIILESQNEPGAVLDVGDLVVMAGLVDSHVHVNDPGRAHWEGFPTATLAAAAGGVTTIVDMPLNSLPPTTTADNLAVKVQAAQGQVHVDVAFWGGIIPGNQDDLVPLLKAGARGFKCFMCHSGVDEFPQVVRNDLETAYSRLQNTSSRILFHAEVDCCHAVQHSDKEPHLYQSFLESRPDEMEIQAIALVIELCRKYRVPSHIVHLSCAGTIPMITDAKNEGIPLTVETCPHYLTLAAEDVPAKATQFKCCPPIRNKANQDKLWAAVLDGTIDMVVSDHSPAPSELKCTETGDFMRAWGGIASLQLVLPLTWSHGRPLGLSLIDLTRLLSAKTARLAGLDHRKGRIAVGLDADLVIWDPDADVEVTKELLHFRHKMSPYLGQVLRGRIETTVLRGRAVYTWAQGHIAATPSGVLLLDNPLVLPAGAQ